MGWKGSPDTLNPGTAQLSEAYTIFELVYDSMYDLQLDGSFTLSLAESVQTSQDGAEWRFTLRPSVTFHDGKPLTAKDVAFSYNFYKANADFPYMNLYTQFFDSIEAIDDRTVVIKLSQAIPNMESQLVFLYVLPEHIWSAHTEGKAPSEFENLEMIGSGPFKLVEYKQNEFVHLAAHKEHFATPPKVDEAIFQTFGNEDALVQAIQTGQVDMITEMPSTAVPVLRNAENVSLVIGAPFAPTVTDIVINQIKPENCPTDAGGKCTGHPALLDRNVRLAMAHATDKQNIIDVVLLGLGSPGLTLLPDGLGIWYNNSLQDYTFDIPNANKILDDAGYKDTNSDGVRELPDGSRPLVFRLQWPNDSVSAPRTAELLGQTWSQIGIKTEPQAVDPDALTALCCPGFDFDLMIWGWGSDPDPNLLLNVMTSEAIPDASNESGYSNPEFDELYVQQAAELDKEKRKDLIWKMQEIVHHEVVYIIPYYPQVAQAYRTDRFTGWIDDQPKVALEDTTSLVKIEPVK
jgi:peptide/nickel transport system substrate-binding protein